MKIYACNQGERSVGIEPLDLTIYCNADIDSFNTQERKDIRKIIKKLVLALDDDMGRIDVTFEDECFDCGEKLVKEGSGYKLCKCN